MFVMWRSNDSVLFTIIMLLAFVYESGIQIHALSFTV